MPVLDIDSGSSGEATVACEPWATVADMCAPCNTYESELVDLDAWIDVATLVLFRLTRSRFPGVCTDSIRPCAPEPRCERSCSCPGISALRLPGQPVATVDRVVLDGVEVPAWDGVNVGWRVDDARDLVLVVPNRSEGHGPRGRRAWPCCQDMRLPDTAEGSWRVNYSYGTAPPPGAAAVTAQLACQLALSCDPDAIEQGLCQLPEQTTQVSRQGITMTVSATSSLFANGFTGLRSVDLWVASVNRDGQRPAHAYRPGASRRARRFDEPG